MPKKKVEEPKKKPVTWDMLDKVIVAIDDICEAYGFEVGQVTADLQGRKVVIIFDDKEEEN